jgi:hypothetical protein
MTKIFLLSPIFILFSVFNISAQAPPIEWQKTIGGDLADFLQVVNTTSDGGYLFAGYSYSNISGNKTEGPMGNADYWIVRTNSSGTILWQNVIGGSLYDFLTCSQQTTDGGFILGGYSSSGISGDKTESNMGEYDYWIIKTDASGNISWQNSIKTNKNDMLTSIAQTADGGYIAGGSSAGGISGDKTESNKGLDDLWILKLNSIGNIEWQNTIGGSSIDLLVSISQTADGGYIVGSSSFSGISVDKTEANIGAYDYWILKLNALGNIVWQNTIGGDNVDALNIIKQTSEGNYIVGGYSTSSLSGDKSEAQIGDSDYWILKLDNLGNILWQNTIGGINKEVLTAIEETSEQEYLINGYSNSSISGDKTEVSQGGEFYGDYWILKLNNTGSLIWQNTIGGSAEDIASGMDITSDGGFILAGSSGSSISGDKSEGIFGVNDYWAVKFGGCVPVTETCNALDDNCNGIIDDGVIETINISAFGATTFCQGNSVLLNAIYSGPLVQWKRNGVNIAGAINPTYLVNKTGTYTAVTTSACNSATSSPIIVTVNKNPNAIISAGGATTFCAGGSVLLSEVPVAGCSYQWYKGASAIAGATTTNYTATTAGNYKCRVTKIASGCFKNSNAISVTVPCKEGEELINEENNNFTIYPNPNTGTFNLIFTSSTGGTSPLKGGPRGVTTLQIFNSLGQQIHSQQINSTGGNINETISINNLSSGIYFVRLGNENHYSEQKLIIE